MRVLMIAAFLRNGEAVFFPTYVVVSQRDAERSLHRTFETRLSVIADEFVRKVYFGKEWN